MTKPLATGEPECHVHTKKTATRPWMRDKSDKQNKRLANRQLRKATNQTIRTYMSEDDAEDLVLPLIREVSDADGFHPRDVTKREEDPEEMIRGRRK